MGEAADRGVPLSFNGSIRIEGRGEALTADAGTLILREVDEKLGLIHSLAEKLDDRRDPRYVTHPIEELLRARIFAFALGYGSQDSLDRLRFDAGFVVGTSVRRGLRPLEDARDAEDPSGLGSQPTQSRLIEMLSSDVNLATLNENLLEMARRDLMACKGKKFAEVTLDIDSTPIEVHGNQAGSEYNGYYECRCYHPLFVMLAETSHWVAARLRPGNAHTAAGGIEDLMPLIDRVEDQIGHVASVRGDAGFPEDGILGALEERRIGYAFRIKRNPVLEALAEPYLQRWTPAGVDLWFHELDYKAEPWTRSRRIVLVVVQRPGQLFREHFFLVTNWSATQMPAKELLEFYRLRGTFEGHIGELKSVFDPALSCTSRPKTHVGGEIPKRRTEPRDGERANAVTLLLYLHAYNLANTVRRVASKALPLPDGSTWSLGRVRSTLLKAAARVVISARRAVFMLNASISVLYGAFLLHLAHAFAKAAPD